MDGSSSTMQPAGGRVLAERPQRPVDWLGQPFGKPCDPGGVSRSGALLRGSLAQQPRLEIVQHDPRVRAALISVNHHVGPPDLKPGDPNDRPVRSSERRPGRE